MVVLVLLSELVPDRGQPLAVAAPGGVNSTRTSLVASRATDSKFLPTDLDWLLVPVLGDVG